MKKGIYFLFNIADKLFLDISKELLRENLFASFSGLALAKSKILSNPIFQEICYLSEIVSLPTKDFFIDEDYLDMVEAKYNLVLSDLIHADRHLVLLPSNERLYFAQEIIKAIIQSISKQNTAFVLSYSLSDFSSYFIAHYCKVEKIPFLYFVYARLGSNIIFSNRFDTGVLGFNQELTKNKIAFQLDPQHSNEIEKFVNQYVAAKKQPGYVSSEAMKYKILNIEDIKATVKYFLGYFTDPNGFHYDKNPFLLPYYRLQRIRRKNNYVSSIKKKLVSLQKLKEKKYFIYPLHFHPEAATLIQGRWLNHQETIIEMISKALPANILLIIKEHRVSIGRRKKGFFERIVNFHNVNFVHENADVYELLQNSSGVITISSSMGLEALMLKKPVITFGDIFYNYTNNTYTATDFSKIPQLIKAALNHQFDWLDMLALLKTHTDKMIDVKGDIPTNFSKEYPAIFVNQIKQTIKDRNCLTSKS